MLSIAVRRRVAACLIVVVAAVSLLGARLSAQAGLRIDVVDGEDAVNIIQQRTAVAPVVVVRDRNNQPIAGAVVVFTVGGGNQSTFAGGVRTVTVTTDGTGRASSTALTPVSNGRVSIQVQASYQGQTASTTISQTNYATAAQARAAQVSQPGTSSNPTSATPRETPAQPGNAVQPVTAAGGAAAGGGLSALAIGGIAAGAGVGTLVAVKAAGGDEGGSSNASGTYTGPFSGPFVYTGTIGAVTCTFSYALSGTLALTIDKSASGTVQGTGNYTNGTVLCTPVFPGSPNGPTASSTVPINGSVTGPESQIRFATTQTIVVLTDTTTITHTFSGALSGTTITGSLKVDWVGTSSAVSGAIATGTLTMPVTLRRN